MDATDRASLSYDAVNELLSCVLASMNTLSYEAAINLARKIDGNDAGLPFPVTPFTRGAVRLRRRIAGDLAGVLHDDLESLKGARKAGNVHLEIETLRSLAADYTAANSVVNRIITLEEALALERSLQPPVPSAAEYPFVYSFESTLVDLGDAYLSA